MKPKPETQTIHLVLSDAELEIVDAEATRMLIRAGGGRFSRADVIRSALVALNDQTVVTTFDANGGGAVVRSTLPVAQRVSITRGKMDGVFYLKGELDPPLGVPARALSKIDVSGAAINVSLKKVPTRKGTKGTK